MRRAGALLVFALVSAAGCSPSPSSSGTSGAGGSCPNDLPASCPPAAPGYKATIAPIFNVSCVSCHEPGGSSTIDLQTYDEVFAQRDSILHQVYACRMPPADFPPLTSGARDDVLAWLVCGAPDD